MPTAILLAFASFAAPLSIYFEGVHLLADSFMLPNWPLISHPHHN
jgi:hypothetical protein